MKMQENRVPKIRFPGFADDWEQRKLGDIADVTKLAGFEFTKYVVYSEEGNIIALRGLNIKNGQLVLNDVKYIDRSDFSKLNRSKLYVDDIMFTYVGTVGEVAIIKENNRFYLAPNVSRIRVQSNDSPKFISHYMRTDSFYRHIIFPLIATSSQPALSMENIRKFEICLPRKREEQDRLSEYFDALDNLITLHQRKLNAVKQYKAGMLQKMFPRDGEKVPEVRFLGFTDDWEQRKLGELIEDGTILEQSDGNHGELYPRSEEFTSEGIPYIAASSISSDGESIDFNLTKFLPAERAKQFRKGVAKSGDVLLAHNATVGPSVMLSMDYEFAILSTSLTLYRLDKEKMSPEFFLQAIRSGYFQNQLEVFMKQTTRSQVPILTQRNLLICYPKNKKEQTRIGQVLSNLDNIIALHQRKLDQLKLYKQGLLQKMFV